MDSTHNLISAKILLDSVASNAPRLTTWLVTMPRVILAEWNTHRAFSRNAASSRAIPVEKCLKQVRENPFIPLVWYKNKPGMQGTVRLEGAELDRAISEWLLARDLAVAQAEAMNRLGIHKQIVNRLIEPWRYVEVLMTCCDLGMQNFFSLRAEDAAEPHMQDLAYKMLELYNTSTPKTLKPGEWHIPYGDNMPQGLTWEVQLKIAVARAARLSYENFDGTFSVEDDIKLHDRLALQGHWSSFEHIAQVFPRGGVPVVGKDGDMTLYHRGGSPMLHGNLEPGWVQLRKTYPTECRTDERVLPLSGDEDL